ncbi:MAG: T9SS type A sorting domain-containing protein [Saprospiraceae bacterium]
MNKLFTLIGFVLFCATAAQAQCPFNLTLTTQAQVDNFVVQYPACTIIQGTVLVQSGDAITNLNALSNLTFVLGNLSIQNNNMLTSLNGLQNLAGVGNNIDIVTNAKLANLNGLTSLATVTNDLSIDNNALLTSITGLGNLTTVGGSMTLANNPKLATSAGMSKLNTISGTLSVFQNTLLADLNGFGALQTLGDLLVTTNPALGNCANPGICKYVKSPGQSATIANNKTGCNSVSQVITACQLVDVSAPNAQPLSVSPNPATDWIRIAGLGEAAATLQVYDAAGRSVMTRDIRNDQILSVSNLRPGFYILSIQSADGLYQGSFVRN